MPSQGTQGTRSTSAAAGAGPSNALPSGSRPRNPTTDSTSTPNGASASNGPERNGRSTRPPPAMVQTGMIPPDSPLHSQAATSSLALTPRSPASVQRRGRPSIASTAGTPGAGGGGTSGTPGRVMSSTPNSTPSLSSTPLGHPGPSTAGPQAPTTGDPLGLRKRTGGARPARPSSLGSFMSLPGGRGRGHQLVGEGDEPEGGAEGGEESVEMEVEAELLGERSHLPPDADEALLQTQDDLSLDSDSSLIHRLRLMRDDALTQHLPLSSAFWGGKVYLLTGDPNDAFWLARGYCSMGEWARAEKVLMGPRRVPLQPSATSSGQGKGKDKASVGDLTVHDDGRSFADVFYSPSTSTHPPVPAATVPTAAAKGQVVRMTDQSIACRYLAAQCMVRQGKWTESLALLGDTNPFRPRAASKRVDRDQDRDPGRGEHEASSDGGIKFEASMCHLRGVVHLHHKATDKAKECFLEALSLDVKCYESFEALVGGHMLEPEEEWEFVQSLAYRSQLPTEDALFVRSLYTSRLSKSSTHLAEVRRALETLREEFGLKDDPDVMYAAAEALFGAWRWADCYRVTSRILALHDMHALTLPLHLTCMYHLSHTHAALFVLAHDLIERSPDEPVSWYAAGLWYFAQGRWDECRRFFSKAAMLDTRFAPAWFGFGHSLALEGEHDQAITAYSTAQHHFQGTHLPLLFIGMQHGLLGNTVLAGEYLDAAYGMCKDDPLLLNERGVVAYYEERWDDAVECFEVALDLARKVQCAQVTWAPTYLNLCHCRRNLGRYEEALEVGRKALELDPRSAATLTALGMVYQSMDRTQDAIEYYHQSLALLPADPVTTELLRLTLDRSSFLNVGQSPGTSFHYPGLPFAVGYTLDNEVDQDDVEVARWGKAIRVDPSERARSRRAGTEGEEESMVMEE